MDRGVLQYASESDMPGKTKGAALVHLSAVLGYAPARELVVRNYPHSEAVRNAAPEKDAVRFAVALLAEDGAPSRETAELAVALGSYFSRRGEALRFARDLVDAISDQDRLQSADGIAMLGSIFGRVRGVCMGIKRVISTESAIDEDECTEPLRERLLEHVRSKRGAGIDADARQRAMLLLKEADGVGK